MQASLVPRAQPRGSRRTSLSGAATIAAERRQERGGLLVQRRAVGGEVRGAERTTRRYLQKSVRLEPVASRPPYLNAGSTSSAKSVMSSVSGKRGNTSGKWSNPSSIRSAR